MRKALSIYQLFNTYTKDQINRVIATLTVSERELIKLRYGSDLENPSFEYELSKEQSDCFYKIIVPKIRRRLKNPTRSKYKDYTKSINLYEYFSYYTKEEIDEVISNSKGYEIRLLKMYCGEDYRGTALNIELTEQEKYYFLNNVLTTIRKKLANTYNEKAHSITRFKRLTIYEYFSKYSKEEIDRVIENLNSEEKALLKIKFASEDNVANFVEMTPEQTKEAKSLTTKIKHYLNNPHLDMKIVQGTCLKTIYKRLSGHTKEQIDTVIELLTDEDKVLLELRYGPDFSNPVITEGWNREASYRFNTYLIPKMKRMLKNPAYASIKGRSAIPIYTYFAEYSKQQIDEMLLKLNDEEKRLLKLKYGDDLENPITSVEMTTQDKNLFEIVKKKMRRLLKNPNVQPNSYILVLPEIYSFFEKYKKKDIDEVLSSLEEEEKILLYIKFGKKIDRFSEVMTGIQPDPKKCYTLFEKIRYSLNQKQLGSTWKRKLKSIYECFSEYDRRQIERVIAELSPEERELLHKKYGDDLENPVSKYSITLEEKGKIQYLLMVKIKNRLEEIERQNNFNEQTSEKKVKLDTKSKDILAYLFELLHTPKYCYLLQDYSIKEAMVILLKFGFIKDIFFSIGDIAVYLRLDTCEVIEICKRYLLDQKGKITVEDSMNQKVKH